MRIRSAVFCGGVGAIVLGVGVLGCSDDEPAPAGTPEAGGGGSTGTGGAKTGGAPSTGGAKTGGAGGANTGGAGGANTGGANTGGTDAGPDGSDGGYKAPTPPLP